VDVNGETIIFDQDHEARCDDSELIRRAMKMLDECGDVLEVQWNGSGGGVAPLGALPAYAGKDWVFSAAERLGSTRC
jgi:hypothetical protein